MFPWLAKISLKWSLWPPVRALCPKVDSRHCNLSSVGVWRAYVTVQCPSVCLSHRALQQRARGVCCCGPHRRHCDVGRALAKCLKFVSKTSSNRSFVSIDTDTAYKLNYETLRKISNLKKVKSVVGSQPAVTQEFLSCRLHEKNTTVVVWVK